MPLVLPNNADATYPRQAVPMAADTAARNLDIDYFGLKYLRNANRWT